MTAARILLANSFGARSYRVDTASKMRDMDDIVAKTSVDLVTLNASRGAWSSTCTASATRTQTLYAQRTDGADSERG